MRDIENSPAAQCVRLSSCERAIEVLTDATEKLGQTANDIKIILALAQQTQAEHAETIRANSLDITTLKTDRAFVLGSWKALCVAGCVIVGVSGVSSAACAWFTIKQNQPTREAR